MRKLRKVLSATTITRFEHAKTHQPEYHPNSRVCAELGTKSLVGIIGPCSVGKNYVIDRLIADDERFRPVRSISTRGSRPDDTSDTMQLFAKTDEGIDELVTLIEEGRAINYVIHPTTGELYGTLDTSYPGEFNLLPMLSSSADTFRHLPFRDVHLIGLVAPPDAWERWFEQRHFENADDRTKRLAEGAQSLDWLLANGDASIICNQPGNPQYAASAIKAVVEQQFVLRDEQAAEQLRARINTLRR